MLRSTVFVHAALIITHIRRIIFCASTFVLKLYLWLCSRPGLSLWILDYSAPSFVSDTSSRTLDVGHPASLLASLHGLRLPGYAPGFPFTDFDTRLCFWLLSTDLGYPALLLASPSRTSDTRLCSWLLFTDFGHPATLLASPSRTADTRLCFWLLFTDFGHPALLLASLHGLRTPGYASGFPFTDCGHPALLLASLHGLRTPGFAPGLSSRHLGPDSDTPPLVTGVTIPTGLKGYSSADGQHRTAAAAASKNGSTGQKPPADKGSHYQETRRPAKERPHKHEGTKENQTAPRSSRNVR